ncbi:hypothetical protein ZOSMA_1G03350 [Zostera marina]|uniref:Uncharacterized protein n=1 Tax=Zostera marina TaxID=29655 RepID=A0A0K9PMQ5_ZOSMR|nr:hypothetical protein ZOSMA_1G03350 [Zostera marina]
MNLNGSVVLDIDSLVQLSLDKSSGGSSPKTTKALSRKNCGRMERRSCEDVEIDDPSRKNIVKVVTPQIDPLKQPSATSKTLMVSTATANNLCLADSLDGRNKRFNRFTSINPRKILLLFATMSSMGTMILIYFTLTISRRGKM